MVLDGAAAASISDCAAALQAGELVAIPTETVYGLAADAGNDRAVARIFAAKGRPSDHPLIVHVDDSDGGTPGMDFFSTGVPPYARALARRFWPGPLTLILPRRPELGRAAAGGQDSIGVRCPAHPVAQALLHAGPFVAGDDAGDDVEGDQALGAGTVLVLGAVDREGDADPAEDHFRLVAAGGHQFTGLLLQPAVERVVMRPHGAASGLHLVEEWFHGKGAPGPGGLATTAPAAGGAACQ
jgi:hypothetical protein